MDALPLLGLALVFFTIAWSMRRAKLQVMEDLIGTQKELARMSIQALAIAAKAYFTKYEKFPAKLADLVEPLDSSQPFIETGWSVLLDPWGKEFQYRTDEENGAIVIKIWTVAPDGSRIDNERRK